MMGATYIPWDFVVCQRSIRRSLRDNFIITLSLEMQDVQVHVFECLGSKHASTAMHCHRRSSVIAGGIRFDLKLLSPGGN